MFVALFCFKNWAIFWTARYLWGLPDFSTRQSCWLPDIFELFLPLLQRVTHYIILTMSLWWGNHLGVDRIQTITSSHCTATSRPLLQPIYITVLLDKHWNKKECFTSLLSPTQSYNVLEPNLPHLTLAALSNFGRILLSRAVYRCAYCFWKVRSLWCTNRSDVFSYSAVSRLEVFGVSSGSDSNLPHPSDCGLQVYSMLTGISTKTPWQI